MLSDERLEQIRADDARHGSSHVLAPVLLDRRDLLAEVDRLRKLLVPDDDPRRPVTWGREAEIREKDSRTGELAPGKYFHSVIHDRRDLFALLDHSRRRHAVDVAILTDSLMDDNRYDLGKAAGVAAALAELDRLAAGMVVRGAVVTAQALYDALEHLRRECGPASPVAPHEATLSECRRLREFVVWVAENAMAAPGPSYHDLKAAALKALGEDAGP